MYAYTLQLPIILSKPFYQAPYAALRLRDLPMGLSDGTRKSNYITGQNHDEA